MSTKGTIAHVKVGRGAKRESWHLYTECFDEGPDRGTLHLEHFFNGGTSYMAIPPAVWEVLRAHPSPEMSHWVAEMTPAALRLHCVAEVDQWRKDAKGPGLLAKLARDFWLKGRTRAAQIDHHYESLAAVRRRVLALRRRAKRLAKESAK